MYVSHITQKVFVLRREEEVRFLQFFMEKYWQSTTTHHERIKNQLKLNLKKNKIK